MKKHKNSLDYWGIIYNSIPYNVENQVLPDFVREKIADEVNEAINKALGLNNINEKYVEINVNELEITKKFKKKLKRI